MRTICLYGYTTVLTLLCKHRYQHFFKDLFVLKELLADDTLELPLLWNVLRASLKVGPSSNPSATSLFFMIVTEVLNSDPPLDWFGFDGVIVILLKMGLGANVRECIADGSDL